MYACNQYILISSMLVTSISCISCVYDATGILCVNSGCGGPAPVFALCIAAGKYRDV